jgi:hypothetical protein
VRDPLKIGCGIVLGFIGVAVLCGGIALALTLFCGLTAPSVEEAIEEGGREIATEMAEEYQVTATAAVMEASPTPQLYGEFSLILAERHDVLNIIEEDEYAYCVGLRCLAWVATPEEGVDVFLVLIRVANGGERWIFPSVMPGYVLDTEGEKYREEMGFVIEEAGDPQAEGAVAIETTDMDLVVLSRSRWEDDKIGPGDSCVLGFVFHVPENRTIDRFSFHYEVWETAMPLVGDSWEMEATLSLNGK